MGMSELLLEGSIYEVNFGCNDKMKEYTNSSSGIPELDAIFGSKIKKYKGG